MSHVTGARRDKRAELILERVRLKAKRTLPAYALENMHLEIADAVAGELILHIKTEILGERRTDKVTTQTARVPLNWWQHLRKALGLRHWRGYEIPTQVTVNQYRVYPGITLRNPGDTATLSWQPPEKILQATEDYENEGKV